MPIAQLVIKDQVNIQLLGVDAATNSKIAQALEFFYPGAQYSRPFKQGRWNGRKGFYKKSGVGYLKHLDTIAPILHEADYRLEVWDHRPELDLDFPPIKEDFLAEFNWPEGHRFSGKPIMLEDHQVRMINECFEAKHGLFSASTGAGKTIWAAAMARIIDERGRSITIVPNRDLVENTYADMIMIGLDAGRFMYGVKEIDRRHIVCTWQSLASLHKKTLGKQEQSLALSKEEYEMLMQDQLMIIVDEVHKDTTADSLFALLTGAMADTPLRFGVTGTIPKDAFRRAGLKAAIGDMIGQVRSKELRDKGFLAESHIKAIRLIDNVTLSSYQEEKEYLLSSPARIKFLALFFSQMKESGNTLVLVEWKKTGKALYDELVEVVGEENVSYYDGDNKSTERTKAYKDINKANNQIMIATYGVAAVGINIPRLFNLVMFEPGKGFSQVIQSIGRGLRKAVDKDKGLMWDISSNLKYSSRHLSKRMEYYKEEEHDVSKEDVHWELFMSQFEGQK